jgi:hypothetical protein
MELRMANGLILIGRCLTALMAAMLFGACGNPVEWNDAPPKTSGALVNYHRTDHFVFFYDTSMFTKAEIESNGKTKEAHLSRIEKELGVSFKKEIIVRLISESGQNWAGQAYPREPYFIQETRDYFVRDNGHEIVHIVTFETMGLPDSRFFVEGVAAAHELDDRPKWSRLCHNQADSSALMEILIGMLQVKSSAEVDYALAAAYVEWLEEEFGVERFKSFYRDMSAYRISTLSSLLERNFGANEEALHKRFIEERFDMAKRSKYCGGW